MSKNSRFQLIKNLSIGEWHSETRCIKLVKIKGKYIHTMGYLSELEKTKNKTTKYNFLYPEEALYLMENVIIK